MQRLWESSGRGDSGAGAVYASAMLAIILFVVVLLIIGLGVWAGSGGENEVKARDNRDVMSGGGGFGGS